jgi:uncharacterized cupin superfamily protein
MEPVIIKKPTEGELLQLGVESWPIWEKEVSVFDWFYSEPETFYVLEGRARDVLRPRGKGKG